MFRRLCALTLLLSLPLSASAASEFNPQFIISDSEMQDLSWSMVDVQNFLDSKGSYLRLYRAVDSDGAEKSAAEIIHNASQRYQINPKFLLTTLQKEQSLVTDDNPTQKQLDWATGYAVCDSCSLEDPDVQKHKGFGKQVDNAAGLIRWYYDNKEKSYIKKKDALAFIDSVAVTPQSWATAFLYTYTPHLHGNKNFWRIWQTWFSQLYPNGTLLKSASSSEMWLLQNGQKRRFKTQTALVTRADPSMAIIIPEVDLSNYPTGPEIALPNYSLLKTDNGKYYLVDYDAIRPFASAEVVQKLGYHPDEIIDVAESDLSGYSIGTIITASSSAPQGVIYQITDLNNTYYLLKDDVLRPISDQKVVNINYKNLKIEKHKKKELAQYTIEESPLTFKDGALLKTSDSPSIYVIENGRKRKLADKETFLAMGYKTDNINSVSLKTLLTIPNGETLFLNSDLLSAQNKFLGDSEAPVQDFYSSDLPAYLVAEYPSGRIISGKDIDTKYPIASLTKIMTAYEALSQNFNQKTSIKYDPKKYGSYGNPLKLKATQKITGGDALASMLVISANNMARLVAQNSGLKEKDFMAAVNQRLTDWGADDTYLEEPTGLSAKNVSTARNLLKIFIKTLKNDTLKTLLGKEAYTVQVAGVKRTIKNVNNLTHTKLDGYQIIASKTGYIDEVGSNLIMLVKSLKDDKQYVILTMGNKDYAKRFVEPNKIADWATSGVVKIAAE